MHAFPCICIHTVDTQTCDPNYIVTKIPRKCRLVFSEFCKWASITCITTHGESISKCLWIHLHWDDPRTLQLNMCKRKIKFVPLLPDFSFTLLISVKETSILGFEVSELSLIIINTFLFLIIITLTTIPYIKKLFPFPHHECYFPGMYIVHGCRFI